MSTTSTLLSRANITMELEVSKGKKWNKMSNPSFMIKRLIKLEES